MAKAQDFTNGSIKKQILTFALPILLGNLFQQFYTLADTAIAGHILGDSALSAIGATSSVSSLILTVAFGINAGFGIVIAQAFGEKNYRKLKRSFAQSIVFGLIFSVLVAAISPLILNSVLRAMNTPEEIFSEARAYILILLEFVIVTMFYNLEATVLRSLGDSKTSVIFIVISTIINIFLDWLFMAKFNLGVEGAAAATVIAQGISCLLCAAVIVKSFKIIRLEKDSFKKDIPLMRSMLTSGLVMGMMNSIFSIGSIILQSAVNNLGSQIIAAQLAARKISDMYMQPLVTVGTSCSTIVSQNYGAGNLKRVKSGMWTALLMSTVYTILTGALLLAFSHPVMRLFTSDSAAIHYGVLAMKYFCPYYVLLGALNVLAGTVRGTGKSIPPMLILLFSMCIFRIIWIQLAVPHYDNIDGVFILYPISWIIGLVLMALYTWKGHWLHYGNENERAKEA